jgi:hypothetical protein
MSHDAIAVGAFLLVLALSAALLTVVLQCRARSTRPSDINAVPPPPKPPSSTPTDPYLGLPDTHVIAACPRVEIGNEQIPLRDWMKHHAGDNAWPAIVAEFYRRAAATPAIAAYFTNVDMEKLQRHFLAALLIVTGQGPTVGALRTLHDSHQGVHNAAGEPITSRVRDLTTAILLEVLADRGCGCLKPCTQPLTCCFAADRRRA